MGLILSCELFIILLIQVRAKYGQERILVADMRVGMDADRGDVEFPAGGALVQGLDVLEDVLELIPARRDQVLRQGIKHEGVVRIR